MLVVSGQEEEGLEEATEGPRRPPEGFAVMQGPAPAPAAQLASELPAGGKAWSGVSRRKQAQLDSGGYGIVLQACKLPNQHFFAPSCRGTPAARNRTKYEEKEEVETLMEIPELEDEAGTGDITNQVISSKLAFKIEAQTVCQ